MSGLFRYQNFLFRPPSRPSTTIVDTSRLAADVRIHVVIDDADRTPTAEWLVEVISRDNPTHCHCPRVRLCNISTKHNAY
jgi:hypothetical protein